MPDARLEIADGPPGDGRDPGAVPPPLPPDDPEAWYAPDVQAQYEVHPGVVVTVARRATDFTYRVREPVLNRGDAAVLDRVERRFADASVERPRTREGTVEVMREGLDGGRDRIVDRVADVSPAASRRLTYHARSRIAAFGELTPYALDDRIEVVDPGPERLVVHTGNFAPAVTDAPPDHEYVDRLASERVERYTVEFRGFEVPVVRYRENRLGSGAFARKYAALEPRLRTGDEATVAACARRLREDGDVWSPGQADDAAREAARSLVARRLSGSGRIGIRGATGWLRGVLAALGLRPPSVGFREADARVDDLAYHVLRDAVGFGPLTVPLVDPETEGVEVNGVDERIVVRDGDERLPTDLRFADEAALRRVTERVAGVGGEDPDPAAPTAVSTIESPDFDATLRCAIARRTAGEDGPALTIEKLPARPSTPVGLVERGAIPSDLVALLWLCCEHRGAVLFSGPDGGATRALLSAFAPFVPFADRPVAVAPKGKRIDLPHETGVSLVAGRRDGAAVDRLLSDSAALDPDVVIASGIRGEAGFRALGEHRNAGRGVLGTTAARNLEVLVERAVARGMAPSLVREIDLVVFARRADGAVVVDEAVELLPESEYHELDDAGDRGVATVQGAPVYWNTVASRTGDGEFEVAAVGSPQGEGRVLARLAAGSGRSLAAVREEFRRKRRYVRYLVREGIDDREALCALLADLEADEAATVERLDRRSPRVADARTDRHPDAWPGDRKG